MRKLLNVILVVLLSVSLINSQTYTCATHPVLHLLKQLGKDFEDVQEVMQYKTEWESSFAARTAAVPSSSDQSEFDACPQFKTEATCCTGNTLKLLKALAKAFMENTLNKFKGDNSTGSDIPDQTPNFSNPRWDRLRPCFRLGAKLAFQDFMKEWKSTNQATPPAPSQESGNGEQRTPPTGEDGKGEQKPQDLEGIVKKAIFRRELTFMKLLRSQLCSLCVPPSKVSDYFTIQNPMTPQNVTKAKFEKNSIKKAYEQLKMAMDALEKANKQQVKFLMEHVKHVFRNNNQTCLNAAKRLFLENDTFKAQGNPCQKQGNDCEKAGKEMAPSFFNTQNRPNKEFHDKMAPPRGNPDQNFLRAFRFVQSSSSNTEESDSGLQYTETSSDNSYTYEGISGSDVSGSGNNNNKFSLFIKSSIAILFAIITIIL